MTPGTEKQNKMEKNYDPLKAREAIHSGHFMVSDIDDTEAPDDDDTISVPVLDAEDRAEVVPENHGFNFDNACKETSDTYMFGPRCTKSISIDATLTKLFQCMTIAYSGKLTSPRWKNFKGLKLRWKDKIRLNNVIWRAWHMQFVKRKSPIVCQFASPLDGDTHNKPEAVVLEGKYWKRRLETVCAEYKKWRLFYKAKAERNSRALSDAGFDLELFNWQPRSNQSFHSSSSMVIDDDPFMDFNDTLFSCLIPNQPFAFPNPREIARAGLADLIQPGLVQLQPNLDDFMDTFDIFTSRMSHAGTLQEEGTLQDFLSSASRQEMINAASRNSASTQDCFNQSMLPRQGNQENLQFSANKMYPENNAISSYTVEENEFMDTQLSTVETDSKIPNAISSEMDSISKASDMQGLSLVADNQPLCSGLLSPNDSASLGLGLNSSENSQPQQQQQQQQQTQNDFSQPPDNLYMVSQALTVNSLAQPKTTASKYVNILPAPPNSASSSSLLAPFLEENSMHLLQQPNTSTVLVPARSTSEMKSSSILKSSAVNQQINQVDTSNSAKQDVFIMPKTTSRRARSMSGPQTPSPGAITFCAATANRTLPSSSNVVSSVTPVLPQNALLAQLLTTGTYLQTTKEETPPTTSAVTIISTVANVQPTQTLIISPATLASVNDLSNQILQASPDQLINPNNAVSALAISVADSNLSTKVGNSLKSQVLNNNRTLSMETRTSPPKPFRPKTDTERVHYREHRRVCHINAEQKRRCNIKTGFDTLHNLIPSLSQNPNAKVSKAAMLQKAGEYIVQLRTERAALQEEADLLRKQIDTLNQAISTCQAQLPACGAPISRQRASKLKEMFDEYVRKRTQQNWKFWIFSILIQPLLDSYNNAVSTASLEELCHTVLTWLEQHCSLVALRPAVLNSLRHLSTTTNILTDPTNIPQEAAIAVTKAATQRRQ